MVSRAWWFAALVVFASVYLLLQLFSFGSFESDENIYFYQAYRAAEGAALYRDYPHSHPPLTCCRRSHSSRPPMASTRTSSASCR